MYNKDVVLQISPPLSHANIDTLTTLNPHPKSLNKEGVLQFSPRLSHANIDTLTTLNSDPKVLHEHHSDRQHQALQMMRKSSMPEPDMTISGRMRRIFIGRTEEEALYDQRHHKKLGWWRDEARRHIAEFIGTFFLILFICGIQVNQGLYPNGGVANIDKGVVSGFVLVGLIFSFGRISGAHFNPCVTLAFTLRGAFNFWRFLTYAVAQFGGAVAAAAVLYGLFGMFDNLGATTPGFGLGNADAFGVEILITFLLITVILSTSEDSNIEDSTAGLAVGLTFGAIEVWAWNFSGASVNPWRSIAPILISDHGWSTYWIYIVGPLAGTIIAVLLQRFMVTGLPRCDAPGADRVSGKRHSDKNGESPCHH